MEKYQSVLAELEESYPETSPGSSNTRKTDAVSCSRSVLLSASVSLCLWLRLSPSGSLCLSVSLSLSVSLCLSLSLSLFLSLSLSLSFSLSFSLFLTIPLPLRYLFTRHLVAHVRTHTAPVHHRAVFRWSVRPTLYHAWAPWATIGAEVSVRCCPNRVFEHHAR
jgi:hypothetical protein